MKEKFTWTVLLLVATLSISVAFPRHSFPSRPTASLEKPKPPGHPRWDHPMLNAEQIRDTVSTVKGRVIDDKDEPLIGVTIMVAGTTKGTVTDVDGNFTLEGVGPNTTLNFSFIGYSPQQIPVAGQTKFEITLQEDYKILDEVVVVGFGQQKKQSVVGSIVQMSEEVIQRNGNVTDLKEALSGQLPGIVSITSSGEPGGITTGESATNIFIRGQNTWNGGQPLILVDNVERSMSNIDPNEVASISVLKDASATAVFGVKGANGVILITTKRGAQGKTKLNFNYTTTAKTVSRQPDKLDSYAAMMAKNEIIEREGVLNQPSWNAYVPYDIVQRYQLPQSAEYAEIYPNVDWSKAMFKDVGYSHRATLSASGGSKAVQYFGSLAYLNEGDMFREHDNGKGYKPNYDFNRFNFRSNIDVRLTKTTKLKLNFAGYYSQKNTNYNNEGSTSRADQWMWSAAYFLAPNLFLPRYSDGLWGAYQEGGNNTVNPIAAVYNLGVRQTRATQLNSDFSLEQDLKFITKGLKATASLFYDNNIRSEGGIYDVSNHIRPAEAGTNVAYKQIYPQLYVGADQDPSEYTAYLPVSDEEYDWILRPWTIRQENISAANWSSSIPITRRLMYQFQLNYARQFKKHNVTAMGLVKREESASGSMFKNYREDWVFRATYDYDTKYLFEVNGAYNGSEQFGPQYRFDFFPSVGLGWVASNEKFFKNPIMDHLKFRYSLGKVGDDNISGSRWLYASQLSYGGRSRLTQNTNGTSPYTFYSESVVGNPDIHWETAVKSNFGIEMGFFESMLNVNVDIFNENRTNVLMSGNSRNVPPTFGTTPPSANLGQVKSKGYEIELKLNKRLNPNLTIWSNISFSHNQNTIIAKDDAPLQYDYLKAAGYPIGQNRSLISSGFYNNWDEIYASVPTETNDLQKLPGYYNLVDFNADGIIKNNEDTPPIGYTGVPQNTGTFGIGGNYKGFSVMVQFYGANNVNRVIPFNNYQSDVDILFGHVRDYWSADNQQATSFLPRWKTQAENVGDYYMYDASFLRLRTAELSYNFQKSPLLQKLKMSNMRIFLSGTNLFLWSKLPDDREGTYSGGSATQGAYPTMKRFNLGIDFSF
ncbi:TonB-linked SusC/RagA family outer membrane protein [Dyadobacter jejuensis]|uniref:TonB-linked SusC/RagA family outer membrane protein n=1 Tax=Dyadobacter jejuensis TaxID=1082580 RepID=A0A316AIX1_9BACT|nr:TonB-dependent receptor [Dyadobacter jejuensis]PWJ56924.1 TonB-linked SusC/RagA family outer membrane protein [Dyadobacter jejuensis]